MAVGKLSDAELLDLLREGDHVAFQDLYNRYWKRCLSLAELKTGDLMEAENIVQDVFVSLWKRRRTLQLGGPFENYLFVSVKYRVLKVLARKKLSYAEDLDAAVELWDDSTQDLLAFTELSRRLAAAVAALPETGRLVYRLNKEEGMSYKQIAEETGLTEAAVDGHLVRAKKSLRSALGSFLPVFLL